MLKKLAPLPLFFIAVFILVISVLETASVKYAFSQTASLVSDTEQVEVNYPLPDPSVTPENPLWSVVALVDKLDSTPESYLENADMRLAVGKDMFDRGKFEESIAVLEKAEMYLEQAHLALVQSSETSTEPEFLMQISRSSLKHREVLETILVQSPEDARPVISAFLDTPKLVFEESASALRGLGQTPPSNPF